MGRESLTGASHLFQPPAFKAPGIRWVRTFNEAVSAGSSYEIDTAALLSIVSFSNASLNRTLLRGIERQPWLSNASGYDAAHLAEVPEHGFRRTSAASIAHELKNLLMWEAEQVCAGGDEIVVLLSGGLDSRIVAALLAQLHSDGRIPSRPRAVTWGMPGSRDVVYAEKVARALKLEWARIGLGPQDLLNNISLAAERLGAIHSGEFLHSIGSLLSLPESTIVVAGSFGDSIGRAEFAGLHLLELHDQVVNNYGNLLLSGAARRAAKELDADLRSIQSRSPGRPTYAYHEHWMQGVRMRGNLCHALSMIDQRARTYQMFTAPEVYGHMWSLHPSCRNDRTYAHLLEIVSPELARLPWARTNRAMRGRTVGAESDVRAQYHDYTNWTSGPLRGELERINNPDWFEATGLFSPIAVKQLRNRIRNSKSRVGRDNDVWLWLATFRAFVEYHEHRGVRFVFDSDFERDVEPARTSSSLLNERLSIVSRFPRSVSILKGIRGKFRSIRRVVLFAWARIIYRDTPFIGR